MAPSRPTVPPSGQPDRLAFEDTTQLLARAQDGDNVALELLLGRVVPALQRWARGRLPGWARARAETCDLVQETLICALPRLSAFESRRAGAIHAYFRQAVLNRIRDEIRRTRRGPRFEALNEDHHGNDASPLEKTIGREALDRYETALSRLRPIEREAIIGRLELGYSFRDLAVALGKPSTEAARLTVTRAIVRLAQEMSRADS